MIPHLIGMTTTEFNSYSLVNRLITRTGNLNGITDAVFGVLTGSGLYGTNVYLKGTFVLHSGKKIEEAIDDVKNDLNERITDVETNFEIREGQISSKIKEVNIAYRQQNRAKQMLPVALLLLPLLLPPPGFCK